MLFNYSRSTVEDGLDLKIDESSVKPYGELYSFIREHPNLTAKELAREMGWPLEKVRTNLNTLLSTIDIKISGFRGKEETYEFIDLLKFIKELGHKGGRIPLTALEGAHSFIRYEAVPLPEKDFIKKMRKFYAGTPNWKDLIRVFRLLDGTVIEVLVKGGKVFYPEKYKEDVQRITALEISSDASVLRFIPTPVDALDELLYQTLSQKCDVQKTYLPRVAGGIEAWICEKEKRFYYLKQYQARVEAAFFDFHSDNVFGGWYVPKLTQLLKRKIQEIIKSGPADECLKKLKSLLDKSRATFDRDWVCSDFYYKKWDFAKKWDFLTKKDD